MRTITHDNKTYTIIERPEEFIGFDVIKGEVTVMFGAVSYARVTLQRKGKTKIVYCRADLLPVEVMSIRRDK